MGEDQTVSAIMPGLDPTPRLTLRVMGLESRRLPQETVEGYVVLGGERIFVHVRRGFITFAAAAPRLGTFGSQPKWRAAA